MKISQQQLEGSTNCLDRSFLNAEDFPEETVAKDQIAKYIEGFDFSDNWNENNRWIGHSLNVAHIGSENMEHL